MEALEDLHHAHPDVHVAAALHGTDDEKISHHCLLEMAHQLHLVILWCNVIQN